MVLEIRENKQTVCSTPRFIKRSSTDQTPFLQDLYLPVHFPEPEDKLYLQTKPTHIVSLSSSSKVGDSSHISAQLQLYHRAYDDLDWLS